ncbi:restin homolog isoform X4 [Dermacentor silvarum]|uniref:restin homolog isoform X4 n=1 Tax=Dermacentor silvarum TaxID=543639 RepID=UPI00189A7867|nr:restin homolog isoform X4 [Dermacentor silvarum]
MAEGHRPDTGQQRSSKIARFIPRPQRVIAKKLEDFTALLPKATLNLPPEPEPLPQPTSFSLNHQSTEAPVDEAFRRTHKYLKIGDRVSIGDSKHGVLRYYGETHFAEGVLCGVELDDAAGGKHSGIVDGVAYFACRPNHGIFVPESKVKLRGQQSVRTLPELSSQAQTENEQPAVRPKSASLLSRLPKLGFSGRASKSRQKEIDTTEEVDELRIYVTGRSTEAPSYSADHAPLWRDATATCSPDSDSDDYDHRDSSLHDRVSPEVLQELRSALMSELPPQQPAPDPSAAPKNTLSPIHENSDEVESRCAKKTLSQSPEGAVGGVDFLSPIAEIMDEMDDGSKQDSLGILTDGAMRDIAVSVDGQSYQGVLPNSFSIDDVADIVDEEQLDEGDGEPCAASTTFKPSDPLTDDNIPMISSNVLRILQYNFPDQVDYLNTVMARSGAIITNEPSPLSHTMSETPSSATADLNSDESSMKKTSDSLECSSGFATSIGSVECELPSAADALTAVNLSSLQGEDGTRPKRPTSAYTVRSTDTGFQGDSEMENQSEAGTAVSPCEDKMMRWSTCSSQDSGAVSESEFQRRNLHPDCCPDCGRVPSPAGKHLPSLRLQAPVSKDPMLAVKQDEAGAVQEQFTSEPEVVHAAGEREVTCEEGSSPDAHPAEVGESQANEPETETKDTDDIDTEKPVAEPDEAKVAAMEKVGKAEKTTLKRVPISFPKPAPKVVVSKVKAMIEAGKTESEEPAKKIVRQPKKGRWDDVTSKLAASMADDKAKPKVKEVKSKVFTNLEGAKQQATRPTALPPTLRKTGRCSTSSRGSVRTEADAATPTSERHHDSPCGESSKDDTAESTTTAQDSTIMKGGDAASVHSSGKGAASVKSALSERKTKPTPKRLDYPRPWNTRPPLKDVKKGTAASRVISQGPGTGPPSKIGEARIQAQSKAEFTKEIQRLGALCESKTKELTMLKLQLRHASAGFASFAVIIQHLNAQVLQNDSFRIPKLSEELRKSQEEIEKARIALEEYKNSIEEYKQNQEKEIKAQKAELEVKHAQRIEELEATHKNELTGYLESHARKIEEMKAFYTDIIDSDRKSHEETLDALKQRHREKIDAINEEYSLQLDSINEDHQTRQKELEQRYETLQQQHKALQQQAREFQESVLSDTDAKIQWLSKKNADLQKEVESLNVVLEMRANQIQSLQHANIELERKEEELDRCKAKMQKMEARIEDLQELLNEKAKVQSQLSVENAKLRETSEKQNRQLSRLDMHNEELKYKLRESVSSPMRDGGNKARARSTAHKRYSVADPTAMSQSWHAADHQSSPRASNGGGRLLGVAHGPHRSNQSSHSLPRGSSEGFQPRMRRSMSETSPPQDACVQQLFASFAAADVSGDSSVD